MISYYRFIFCLFLLFYVFITQASQYGPNMLLQKPYKAQDYIGEFIGTFCYGSTNQAYDDFGKVVPFLQHYGKEDILLSFIDPFTDALEVEKIGEADFFGDLFFQCTNLSYYKNMMHHMFIGIGAIIQNLNISISDVNIKLQQELTPEELKLLTAFEAKIPENLNTSGILNAYIEVGYNREFTNLKSTDFLQFFLKGSILTPQWAQGGDLNILQYPFTGNLTFGYQVIAIATMKMTKHMNFSMFGTINSFQSKVTRVPFNEHIMNNNLIIDKEVTAYYTPGTVYNGALYWEFDDFTYPISITTGVSFMYGSSRKIKPIHPDTHIIQPVENINVRLNSTMDSWSINTVFIELDYNFLSEKNLQGPCLTLYFNTPISGVNYPKVNGIGGEFGLTFNYYL